MLQDHITSSRIANAIIQDTGVAYFILVEGIKDLPTYKKLINDTVMVKVTFGKHKMREIDYLLKERGFINYVGIRDSDFLRLKGNPKFQQDYDDVIYATDEHDAESMIIFSNALLEFIDHISNEQNKNNFIKTHGPIRELCYSLCYPLACLRLAAKKYNLGLSFKPVKPEGNKLKYKKFICENTFTYLGHEKMINTVIEYSTNRGSIISSREDILSRLKETILEKHNVTDIVNGHDLSEILYIICKKGIKSQNKLLNDASGVEDMLRMTYNLEHFKKTKLYTDLNSHQITVNKDILRK
ncbi:TPA: DUF4435 domain-containing protein [Klebsiella aerogenes]|nr:DUF4435 domain-containing protein [Klebsiella aerogenes]